MQDCQHAKLSNDRSLVVKRVGLKLCFTENQVCLPETREECEKVEEEECEDVEV